MENSMKIINIFVEPFPNWFENWFLEKKKGKPYQIFTNLKIIHTKNPRAPEEKFTIKKLTPQMKGEKLMQVWTAMLEDKFVHCLSSSFSSSTMMSLLSKYS